jgi:predicted dehydrogenase
MSDEITRREFLKATSGAAVAAGLAGSALVARPAAAQDASRRTAASEKIVLGFIGVASRGYGHMSWFGRHPDVAIGAVCDVYEPHLQRAVQKSGGKAKAYQDYRKLLEQKDLDAVVVATPPHWHPLISIEACEAGLDVYCEKPMSRFPAEGRAMVKAAKKNSRVTQVGTQIHAEENYHRVVEIVRSGILGKITSVRVVCTMNDFPKGLGNPPDESPPSGLDWDMWLGPAPKAPFNWVRFKDGLHRYFEEYVGSWLHELGPHIVDLPVWALNLGEPLAVSASGGKYAATDISTIPDTMDVLWEYPGMTMTWMQMSSNSYNFDFGGPPDTGRRLGVLFHGTDGTLMADYGMHKLVPEGDRLKDVKLPEKSLPRSPGHEREFLDSVKSRKQPSCSFEAHLPLHTALNLGHVALKAGRKIHWDAQKGQVVGDREAQRIALPNYRSPWRLPSV